MSSIMAVVPAFLIPATVGKVSFLIFHRMACSFASFVNAYGNSVGISFIAAAICSHFASTAASFSARTSTSSPAAPGDNVFMYSGTPAAFSTDFMLALSIISTAETGCCLRICTASQASFMVGKIISANPL